MDCLPFPLNGTDYPQMLIDEASATVTYIGYAAQGTATDATGWKIRKVDSSSNPTSSKWAEESSERTDTATWDNRTSLTYS